MKLPITLSIPEDLADLSDADKQLAYDRVSTQKNKADLLKAGILLATYAPILLIMIFRRTMNRTAYISLFFLTLAVMSFLGGAAQKYFDFKLLIKEMRKIKFEQGGPGYPPQGVGSPDP